MSEENKPEPPDGRHLHYSTSERSFHTSDEVRRLRKTTTKLNMILSDKALKWGLRKLHSKK